MARNLAAKGSGSAPGNSRDQVAHTDHVITVATVSLAPWLQTLVNEALATWIPRAAVVPMGREEIIANGAVEVVIVGPAADGPAALPELRLLRSQGYINTVLLLTTVDADSGDSEHVELTRLGARCCALTDGFAERLAALASMTTNKTLPLTDTLIAGLRGEVDETRNLLALAEVARRLPHAMNNPLSALLAEAQLLELEELTPDHREATERIVDLARRVIGLVRELQQAQQRR